MEKVCNVNHYLVVAARTIARQYHSGQKYADGDYFELHLSKVAEMGKTIEEISLGYIHDVVEDCNVALEDVQASLEASCGKYVSHHTSSIESIMAGLESITKREGEVYEEYIKRVKTNSLARRVKQHDAECNMKRCIKDKDYKRAKKYLKVLVELS